MFSGIGLGSNPFGTPVGQVIERATDGNNASEDWAAFMTICDMINGSEETAKDAAKAIKKRLHSSTKSPTVLIYSLTLLETCVKNCSKRFHQCVATKDFMQEMVKVLAPKNDAPPVAQEKILGLIQAWSEAFKGQSDLREVEKVYQELKSKGIEFPMINLDQAPPIHTPARSVVAPPGPVPQSPTHQPMPAALPGHPQPHPTRRPQQHPGQQYPPPGMAPAGMVPAGMVPVGMAPPGMAPPGMSPAQRTGNPVGPEYFVKLRGQLDLVEGNMRVFNEMMNELEAPSAPDDDWQLMLELSGTCKQMQERIVVLLQQIQHEEVTGELLRINDELNNVFVRWERFARGRPAELQAARQPSQAPQAPQVPPALSRGRAPPAMPPAPAPVHAEPVSPQRMAQMNTNPPNLIDLDDAPVSAAAAGVATLSVNNSDGHNDDFDMFAQSRTEPSQPPRGPSSYADQRQTDFAPGLGSAMNARARGESLTDTADHHDEMEQWLKDNPGASQGGPGAQPSTMTSSEFDRFLSDRATAGESLPPSTDASRRQLQKDEAKDTMFAL